MNSSVGIKTEKFGGPTVGDGGVLPPVELLPDRRNSHAGG